MLHALSGGADAFPNTSFYPKDFRPYPPSNIRIERTPKFKLSNLINMGRSGLGGGTRPIASAADFPLTSRRLLQGVARGRSETDGQLHVGAVARVLRVAN